MNYAAPKVGLDFQSPVNVFVTNRFDLNYNADDGLHALWETAKYRNSTFEFEDPTVGTVVAHVNLERHGDGQDLLTLALFMGFDSELTYTVFYINRDEEHGITMLAALNQETGQVEELGVADDDMVTMVMQLLSRIDAMIDILHCNDVLDKPVALIPVEDCEGFEFTVEMREVVYTPGEYKNIGTNDVCNRFANADGDLITAAYLG